jgi:hypothetical protein
VAWKNQFRQYFLTVAAGVFIHPGHGVGIDRTCDLAGALDQPCRPDRAAAGGTIAGSPRGTVDPVLQLRQEP